MTFFDLVMNCPVWVQVIIFIMVVIWLYEMFLFPFKFNFLKHHAEEMMKSQQATLEMLEKKNVELEDTNKMLATMISLLLQKEQKQEKANAK